jgi:hypothetical protein
LPVSHDQRQLIHMDNVVDLRVRGWLAQLTNPPT